MTTAFYALPERAGLPVDDPWQTLEAGLAAFEPGIVLTRQQPDDQIRPEIKP
ncbi:MAG: hypothetical protein Q8N17_02875 [Burkholderiaceae bacterium]|nr:hypothetical protein [Burkholderiaceae bacterium]